MPTVPDTGLFLTLLAEAQADADRATARVKAHVRLARDAGATWEEVGTALGVTRQAAQKRYAAAIYDEPGRE